MIKTTGQLREFLADTMERVKNGKMKAEDASRITKVAAQINESFYSEIKIQRVLREASEKTAALGTLPINMPE